MSHRANASNNQSKEETLSDIKHVIEDLELGDSKRFNLTVTRVDYDTAILVVSLRDEEYEKAVTR